MTDSPFPLITSINEDENNSYHNNNETETKVDFNKKEPITYLSYRTPIVWYFWLVFILIFIIGTTLSIVGIIIQVYRLLGGLICTIFGAVAAAIAPLYIRITIDKKREVVIKT